MGTYNYTVKVDGADTKIPSGITVKVLDGPRETPVKSVPVLPASIKVAPPGSATLVAIVSPNNATNKTVTWSRKSGSSKISVNAADGVVTVAADAPDDASAVIQAAVGGKIATCTIRVSTEKYSITVTGGDPFNNDYNPISNPIEAGTLVQLAPSFKSGDVEFVEWTVTLIEKILVHEATKDEEGNRIQEVEIFYRFIGKID